MASYFKQRYSLIKKIPNILLSETCNLSFREISLLVKCRFKALQDTLQLGVVADF